MKVIFKGKTIEHVGYLNANYDEFEPETLQERIGTINVFLSEVNFDPEFIQLFTTQSEMELEEPEDLTIIYEDIESVCVIHNVVYRQLILGNTGYGMQNNAKSYSIMLSFDIKPGKDENNG